MTSWSMGSLLEIRPKALAFNRILRGPPSDNLKAHPAPAIDPLIPSVPLDAELECHFKDRQPTILRDPL
jgi:hypothetical protein